MSEVGFYHLTRTGVAQALPALLGRTLAVGQRALVLCGSVERVTVLDRVLWEVSEPDWLPHGTEADGDADLQPIWLAADVPSGESERAPNGARFLFLTDGARASRLAGFDRVFDLFDGNDAATVARARERWKAARQDGHVLTYWQQGPRGWEKKA